MTRTKEVRQTAPDITKTLFTELNQSPLHTTQSAGGAESRTDDKNTEKDEMKVKKG